MKQSEDKKQPFVSIIIPCYNEEKYIGPCLESIEHNSYPSDSIEILILDGMSTDCTRDVISDLQVNHPNIKIIDNPDRNKPKALNIGIQKANGEILMRMDGHAIYDKYYIESCVTALIECGADNVGGVRKTLSGDNSIIGKSIAYSLGSRFAVGNARYRTGVDKPEETDIVFLFCCHKELFNKVGLFDERLVRGQDREFNLRLIKEGCRMLLIPDAVSYYYARTSLIKFVHWIYVGGMVPVMISRITGQHLFSVRNFIPTLFLFSLLGLLVTGIFYSISIKLFVALCVLYFLFAFFFSFPFVLKEKNPLFFLSMCFVFFLTHVAYGVGFLAGFTKQFTKDPCV